MSIDGGLQPENFNNQGLYPSADAQQVEFWSELQGDLLQKLKDLGSQATEAALYLDMYGEPANALQIAKLLEHISKHVNEMRGKFAHDSPPPPEDRTAQKTDTDGSSSAAVSNGVKITFTDLPGPNSNNNGKTTDTDPAKAVFVDTANGRNGTARSNGNGTTKTMSEANGSSNSKGNYPAQNHERDRALISDQAIVRLPNDKLREFNSSRGTGYVFQSIPQLTITGERSYKISPNVHEKSLKAPQRGMNVDMLVLNAVLEAVVINCERGISTATIHERTGYTGQKDTIYRAVKRFQEQGIFAATGLDIDSRHTLFSLPPLLEIIEKRPAQNTAETESPTQAEASPTTETDDADKPNGTASSIGRISQLHESVKPPISDKTISRLSIKQLAELKDRGKAKSSDDRVVEITITGDHTFKTNRHPEERSIEPKTKGVNIDVQVFNAVIEAALEGSNGLSVSEIQERIGYFGGSEAIYKTAARFSHEFGVFYHVDIDGAAYFSLPKFVNIIDERLQQPANRSAGTPGFLDLSLPLPMPQLN